MQTTCFGIMFKPVFIVTLVHACRMYVLLVLLQRLQPPLFVMMYEKRIP